MTDNFENLEGNKFTHPYKDNTAVIQRRAPWGLYVISLEHGETPKELKEQMFTGVDFAIQAIKDHLDKRSRTVKA